MIIGLIIMILLCWASFFCGVVYGIYTTVETAIDDNESFEKICKAFIESFRGV